MKRHIALLFLLLMVGVIGCIENEQFDSTLKNLDEKENLELWINNEEQPNGTKRSYFELQGSKVTSIQLKIERICLIPEYRNDDACFEQENTLELNDLSDGNTPAGYFDLIQLLDSNPVLFSKSKVHPGNYIEVQMHLCGTGNTITVNGTQHEIKLSVGSVLRIYGPFTIPDHDLFQIQYDFVVSESIAFIPGEGYVLTPVIQVKDFKTVIGIFEGDLDLNGVVSRMIVQLGQDSAGNNLFSSKSEESPKYHINGNYTYNSILKILTIQNIDIDCPSCSKLKNRLIDRFSDVPSSIDVPVESWLISADNKLLIDFADTNNSINQLKQIDGTFNDISGVPFSGITFTKIKVHVTYPNTNIGEKTIIGAIPGQLGIYYIGEGTLLNGSGDLYFEVGPKVFPFGTTIGTSIPIPIKTILADAPENVNFSVLGHKYKLNSTVKYLLNDLL